MINNHLLALSNLKPVFVGGKVLEQSNASANYVISLTDLTGGISTSPGANDIVLISVCTALTYTTSWGYPATSGYTTIDAIGANDSVDNALTFSYKVMTATPDTSVTMTGTGSSSRTQVVAIQVWRNIDTTNPIDVLAPSVATINTVLANPPSITTITKNSTIIAVGSGGHTISGGISYSSSNLDNFSSVGVSLTTNEIVIGMGSKFIQEIGSFDPAQFSFGSSDSNIYSSCGMTIALKPK